MKICYPTILFFWTQCLKSSPFQPPDNLRPLISTLVKGVFFKTSQHPLLSCTLSIILWFCLSTSLGGRKMVLMQDDPRCSERSFKSPPSPQQHTLPAQEEVAHGFWRGGGSGTLTLSHGSKIEAINCSERTALFLFIFCPPPSGMWDLSSQTTRDWTHVPFIGGAES